MSTAVADADLVRDARAGDAVALGVLLERHRAALYASALGMLREREAAQDAVQDACLVALQRLGDLRDPAAAAAWLHAIVRNACLMHIRRAGRERPGVAHEPRDGLAGIEEALERIALGRWVWTALEELPPDLRVTVMLRYFSRVRSYRQIAATLGVPVGTVRSRLNQARAKLADAMLATASAAHVDHDRLVEQRTREWAAIADEIHTTGRASRYAADCAPDVLVAAPGLAYRERGIAGHRRDVERSAAAGVRLRLAGVVAGPRVTVVEGDLLNPGDDPRHCPGMQTEVRIHPDGRTTRLFLYYSADAAGAGDGEVTGDG